MLASAEYVDQINEDDEPDLWWQLFSALVVIVVAAVLFYSLCHQTWQWLNRPLAQIEVTGQTYHLDKLALAKGLSEQLSGSRLLSLDIEQIYTQIEQHPWVRRVSVETDWPNQLKVTVEEEIAVARWGERGLLNHEGDIFWPGLLKEYSWLPKLDGPANKTESMMAKFHDFNQVFQQAELEVNELELEKRGAWKVKLSNDITVVIGREDTNQRLARFIEVYRQKLAALSERIQRVDIRYTNGVAVEWRPEGASDEAR